MQLILLLRKTLLNIPQMLKIFHLNKNGKEKDLVQTYQGIKDNQLRLWSIEKNRR